MLRIFVNTFGDVLRKYCKRSTINGFKLLHLLWHNKFYRNIWILFMMLHFVNICYHVWEIVEQVSDFPLTISMHGATVHITEITFPAIALCSVNKISRLAVERYAQQLCNASPTYCAEDPNFWLNKMSIFRGYYDSSAIKYDEGLYFQILLQDVLMEYSKSDDGLELNVTRMLEKLAPRCDDLIIECRMSNENNSNCSHLFSMKVTSMGFCCIFNNRKQHSQENNYFVKGVGPRNGLTLLLNTSTSDYFFKPHNWNGVQVEIFSPYSTPEVASGELTSTYITAGSDTDILLKANILDADSNIRYLSPVVRECYFPNERIPNMPFINEEYSFSGCLFHCKIFNIINICKCVPFMADNSIRELINVTMPDCTLEFLDCMHQYDVAFNTFRLKEWSPSQESSVGSFQNLDSLDCSYCLPDCEAPMYSVTTVNRQLGEASRRYIKNQKYDHNIKELALIKFYFQESSIYRYRRHFSRSFTRLLAEYAGILNINMGVSIISFLEFFYFFAFIFFINLIKHYYNLLKCTIHKCTINK